MGSTDQRDQRHRVSVTGITIGLATLASALYAAAHAYWPGADGCGPPSESPNGRTIDLAFWLLPVIAGVVVMAWGLRRRLNQRTIAMSVLVAVLLGLAGDFVVILYVAAANNCTQ